MANSLSSNEGSTCKNRHTLSSTCSSSTEQSLSASDLQALHNSAIPCRYYKQGLCEKSKCEYFHGDICDMCNSPALHPYNEELRKKHKNECIERHEANMQFSFAIERSREKSCGVCLETVMENPTGEQRFGILSNCNHCFCLTCIRKWRRADEFENKVVRACPECRVPSDFVCPSMYWVETKEEKEKLITDYKDALSSKNCKYFKNGYGTCPFGNKCFYLHALLDGTKVNVGPPHKQLLPWDVMDEEDRFLMYSADDFDGWANLGSDPEPESDWSDYELYLRQSPSLI